MLGKTLQEVQDGTTSTEFIEWMAFMDLEVNMFHREDFFHAQTAAEIRRTLVKDPKSVKTSDFLLRFKVEKPTAPLVSGSNEQEARRARALQNKSLWLKAFEVFEKKKGE